MLPHSRGLDLQVEWTNYSTIQYKYQFTDWTLGSSLAITIPILVSFFSSAYLYA
jgi:hypothetical protein